MVLPGPKIDVAVEVDPNADGLELLKTLLGLLVEPKIELGLLLVFCPKTDTVIGVGSLEL